jgi:hypothetical protein
VTTFSAKGTSGIPPTPLGPGVYFWRLSGTEGTVTGDVYGPVWEFTVPVRSTPVNTSWGTIFDCNGDGLADVAAGARSFDQTNDVPGGDSVTTTSGVSRQRQRQRPRRRLRQRRRPPFQANEKCF